MTVDGPAVRTALEPLAENKLCLLAMKKELDALLAESTTPPYRVQGAATKPAGAVAFWQACGFVILDNNDNDSSCCLVCHDQTNIDGWQEARTLVRQTLVSGYRPVASTAETREEAATAVTPVVSPVKKKKGKTAKVKTTASKDEMNLVTPVIANKRTRAKQLRDERAARWENDFLEFSHYKLRPGGSVQQETIVSVFSQGCRAKWTALQRSPEDATITPEEALQVIRQWNDKYGKAQLDDQGVYHGFHMIGSPGEPTKATPPTIATATTEKGAATSLQPLSEKQKTSKKKKNVEKSVLKKDSSATEPDPTIEKSLEASQAAKEELKVKKDKANIAEKKAKKKGTTLDSDALSQETTPVVASSAELSSSQSNEANVELSVSKVAKKGKKADSMAETDTTLYTTPVQKKKEKLKSKKESLDSSKSPKDSSKSSPKEPQSAAVTALMAIAAKTDTKNVKVAVKKKDTTLAKQ